MPGSRCWVSGCHEPGRALPRRPEPRPRLPAAAERGWRSGARGSKRVLAEIEWAKKWEGGGGKKWPKK